MVLSYGSTSRHKRKTRRTRKEKENAREKTERHPVNKERGEEMKSRSTAIQELMLG